MLSIRNFGLLSFGDEAEEDEEMLEDVTEVSFQGNFKWLEIFLFFKLKPRIKKYFKTT